MKGYAQVNVVNFKYKTDSILQVIHVCETDTCRFRILYDFFWQHNSSYPDSVSTIAERAFQEIKESKNLRLRSDGYDLKGLLLERSKNYDSAYYYFQKALLYALHVHYEQRIRWCYFHFGIIYSAKGNTDSALYYYHRLLRLNDMASAPTRFSVIQQIASIYQAVPDRSDSTEKYYNLLAEQSLRSGNLQQKAEIYIALMNYYYETNQIKKLLETINLTLSFAEENKVEKALINVYYMVGDMFLTRKKNYETALLYYDKVLDICRPKYRNWEATILNDMGGVYLQMGDVDKAFELVNRSLFIATELHYKHVISECYRNLGKIYKARGNRPEAIAYFRRCYQTGCDKCPQIVFHHALIDIGDLYMVLHKPDLGRSYYTQSLSLAKRSDAKAEMAISYLRLGNYSLPYNLTGSVAYYDSSMAAAKASGDIRIIKNIADTLNGFYKRTNNYRKAYEFLVLSRTIDDSITRMNDQANLADWQLKLEMEKINKENELNNQLSLVEIKRQKLYRNGAIIISLLVIILSSVVYFYYRRKKKDNIELKIMSEELHQADEMKLRFFANVSHELRTPLSLILNPAKSLLDNAPVNGEQKKYLENIYKNALRLRDLTNQIMDLQQLDAGKLVLCLEEADIIGYCHSIAASFESLCLKKNNTMLIRCNHRSVMASFDKDKLGKILSNLLSNAFKFCFNDTMIELTIRISDNHFNLCVEDHGIGIPANEIQHTFKQYFQASTNHSSEGSGIGLAYVKELTTFMKGTAEIESKVQKGTRVTISLPFISFRIADSSAYELILPQKRISRYKEPAFGEDVREGQKIALIVEDNDELRTFIGDLLKPEYYNVFASDGNEGAAAAFKYLPDIIISDVMMPVMNGFEMCALLKKDERTSHIPVILLTAKDGPNSSLEGYQIGADDYITKPFDNDVFRLKIRNITATLEASRRQFDLKSVLNADTSKFGNTDKEFMRKCVAVIEKYMDDSSFSVDMLAGEMLFSNRNFYRKIKALTNQTPADLIRIYRLHYAKKLLQQTDMKVFEIAMAVGYEDVNRFRQAFKKQFGCPPSKGVTVGLE